MATTPTEERRAASAAVDGACPRCGAARAFDQEYCVECGMRLPRLTGTLPSLRRRWISRFGWYPGDWVWTSLLALLLAGAGAAAAIYFTTEQDAGGRTLVSPTAVASVAEPTTAAPAAVPTVGTTKLPTAPEPTTARTATATATVPNGRTPWPAARNGWTVVLVSYPTDSGRPSATATATRAAKAGLPQVGILDSSNYASMHPGYLVVFSGVYGSEARAAAALRTARASGFAGAYTRPVSR